jgi:uncharacterized protein (TIGR02099 family)
MVTLPHRPSLSLKVLTISTRALLWLILLAWLVFGAAWATLHLVIVPRIGELRPELETRASQALGVPVRIGAIVAHADSLFPSFELGDVQLLDRDGRAALQLPSVRATLSPRSLWNLGFEQLVIESPELNVRRAKDGRIFVAGIELLQSQETDGSAADWVFSQTEWLIRGGRVQWHDELRDAPPLLLQAVDLRMQNGARTHELRLDATPPVELGGRFSLRGRFRQPLLFTSAGDWRRWQGQLYAVFERVDMAQLSRHVPLQLGVAGGSGALRAWVDVDQGRVTGATADVALSQLGLKLGPDLPALDLARLSGRLGGSAREAGYEVYTQGLKFDTRDGLSWPGGDLRVSLDEPVAGALARGEIRLNGIDLATVAQLAQRLPLEPRVHRALQLYAPKGRVEQLLARWQGSWAAPERFDARGRLTRLEVASRPQLQPMAEGEPPPGSVGSPGVRGLTVDFDLTQDGGRASVLVQQGHLELPGVFEQPRIALDQLAAELQWRLQGGLTSLQINNARFANHEAQGEFQLKWQAGAAQARLPGVLDLQGSLSRAELSALHRYLPRAIKPEVRDYLRLALPQGWAGGARFRVKGDLADFPFSRPGQGEFRISASVHDTHFVYVPAGLQTAGQKAWPALTELRGDLLLDHASLQLRNISARLDGAPQLRISQGEASIPDLGQDVRVQTSLQLAGPLDELLRGLINASPLDAMLGGVLGKARALGNADVQLKLDLPLQQLERSVVSGQIKLAGNELQLAPALPRLTRARGTVHFSERGFALAGVQGRLLGGEVRAEGGTMAVPGAAAEALPRLRVQGTLTAQGLRQESRLGALAGMAQQMSGSTAYTAEFGLNQGLPEFQFSSSLQGLALNLPAPLLKPAEATLPLRLQAALMSTEAGGATAGGARRDLLRFDLGQLLALRYVREHNKGTVQVLRGTIGVGLSDGESLPMPETGVVASVQFDELDLDAWRKAAAPPAAPAPAVPGAASDPPVLSALRDYLPTHLMVQGATLQAGGQTFHQLVAGGTREEQTWRVNLDARELSGYLEYRMPVQVGAGSVYARLARLVLAQDNARGVEQLLDEQPVGIPALDVVINSLELRGKNLGRVEIEAVNRGLARRDAGAREWRLSRLRISMPEAEFTASGNWAVYQEAGEPTGRVTLPRVPAVGAPRGERRRTAMNFRIDVADAGGLLSRLGMPGLIRAGKGVMEGQASWIGSPMGLDYPSLGGSFNVNIERGQFLKAEPGIAKLLGVLSLQSLPRRLTLDFRDVFTEGFSFDFVRGDVLVEQGMASTNNLQMKGVNAAVLMSGQADLARETQDLRVVVVPEINAGTASLIATVINPAVGLGTFLAQVLLRKPAIAAATQEFRITGSWTDPQMNKVETPVPPASQPEGNTP